MSNLDRAPQLLTCGGMATVAARPVHELFAGREVELGESTVVRRLLPNLGRRLVGAWCFVDHYGAGDTADISGSVGMQVPPHPHTGLQTVSWLLAGEVHHRDSLGSDQLISPGQLGLMTAGHGITHAEQSPRVPAESPRSPGDFVGNGSPGVPAESPRSPGDFVGSGSPVAHPALLHGVQLWVALPGAARDTVPAWDYHDHLPVLTDRGLSASVLMGSLAGVHSPGRAYSPLVGIDVTLDPGADALLPLEPDFEHAVLVTSGTVQVDGVDLAPGAMLYLGCARRDLRLHSAGGARLLLLGGEPFAEQIVMWWNFVGRSHDEIAAVRAQWADGDRFADVAGYDGYRLPAPPLPPGRLRPGGATR